MTFSQFVEVYAALIRGLAQLEQLQLLVLGDHPYTSYAHRMIPSLAGAITGIGTAIQPLVVERSLLWADLEASISAGGSRDAMILSDGVHMTAEAHERVAAALQPILEAFCTHAMNGERRTGHRVDTRLSPAPQSIRAHAPDHPLLRC